MLEIPVKELEQRLGMNICRNALVIGIDTASRTGWCIIDVGPDTALIDYGFIDIKAPDVYFKYDKMVEYFHSLLTLTPKEGRTVKVIIEDVFFGRNINTLKMLARIGMIVYTIATQLGIPKEFILASSARSRIGFKGTLKKEIVQKQVVKKLKLKLDDVDIIDALVLALVGLVYEKGTLWQEKKKK